MHISEVYRSRSVGVDSGRPESQRFSKIGVEPELMFLRKGRTVAGVSFSIRSYFNKSLRSTVVK